jgi:hypothetical protein
VVGRVEFDRLRVLGHGRGVVLDLEGGVALAGRRNTTRRLSGWIRGKGRRAHALLLGVGGGVDHGVRWWSCWLVRVWIELALCGC